MIYKINCRLLMNKIVKPYNFYEHNIQNETA